mmetsp:Transcript_125034/g.361641  ORF Transcript_125034/g.361641 Transcript_125034/m.361641 type:complete len:215 (-) Transcript_125034:627-1271(-)
MGRRPHSVAGVGEDLRHLMELCLPRLRQDMDIATMRNHVRRRRRVGVGHHGLRAVALERDSQAPGSRSAEVACVLVHAQERQGMRSGLLSEHARRPLPERRDELPAAVAARVDHVLLCACGIYAWLPHLPIGQGQNRHVDGVEESAALAGRQQDRTVAVLLVAVPGEVPVLHVPLLGRLAGRGLLGVRDRLRVADMFRHHVPHACILRLLGEPR